MIKALVRLLTVRTMRESNFFLRCENLLKQHKSYSEQIALLKSRGLIIEDDKVATNILSHVNYYRLSGYLFGFRKPQSENYINGVSIENILRLYRFDSKLTRILMYALENVEESLKTHFSYELSSNYPTEPLIYLDTKLYRNVTEFQTFKGLFEKAKKDNKDLPFIKHHFENYSGDLPIWVAVEIMTMGNIHKLYNNLIGKHQKAIAKIYNTGSMQLKSWIENLTYTRNHLAHYMRVYDYNFGRTPAKCNNHTAFQQTGKIFDQIIAIGFMFSSKTEWRSYVVPEIKKVVEEYQDVIDLDKIGFPKNWEQILLAV